MTRKDYTILVVALRRAMNRASMADTDQTEGVHIAIREIELVLAEDNVRFDVDTFDAAVYKGES